MEGSLTVEIFEFKTLPAVEETTFVESTRSLIELVRNSGKANMMLLKSTAAPWVLLTTWESRMNAKEVFDWLLSFPAAKAWFGKIDQATIKEAHYTQIL